MKPLPPQDEDALDNLRKEAADWLLHLSASDCRDDDGLRRWLALSNDHQRVWEETRAMWRVLGSVPSSAYERVIPAPSIPALTPLPAQIRSRRVKPTGIRKRTIAALVLSASLCFMAFVTGPRFLIEWQADYLTSTGETRLVTMADGSRVQLAADSAIKTNFKDGQREIILLAGEAFFDVAHDNDRPFVVDADGVKIEVLGTAFDVRLGEDATAVALVHGRVRASTTADGLERTRTLAPGDLLSVDRHSKEMSMQQLSTTDIGAWRDGRLFVVNSSIGAVIEQIQRYHPAWIAIPDRSLAGMRVTGIYDLSDPDKALAALVSPYGGIVRKIAGLGRVITRL